MTTTTRIERALVAARDEIRELEEELEAKKKRRDALVIRLRRHADHPSARAIAELAGISAVWVLELAKDPE